MMGRADADAFRFPGGSRGHYESYFLRANHPHEPRAFWIRYTMFAPRGAPERAVAELWAVYFDGAARRVSAVREELPLAEASFAPRGLNVRIGSATLDERALSGEARTGDRRIGWQLRYESHDAPLLLLPEPLYRAPLPKAKALVPAPRALFRGTVTVDGESFAIDGWLGSQNHNWGAKHTDRYAWGQVAGFDDAPDAFFECATASIKLGPVYTPKLSPMVLRLGSDELRLNALRTAFRARASYGLFHWEITSEGEQARIAARFSAHADAFVALRYKNPPGGHKTCLNSKIAACELHVMRRGRPDLTLRTRARAAFEILTDDERHGVPYLDA